MTTSNADDRMLLSGVSCNIRFFLFSYAQSADKKD